MQLLPLLSPLLCNYRQFRCYATTDIAIAIAVAMQLLPLQVAVLTRFASPVGAAPLW
jgi:hypothetical protein